MSISEKGCLWYQTLHFSFRNKGAKYYLGTYMLQALIQIF